MTSPSHLNQDRPHWWIAIPFERLLWLTFKLNWFVIDLSATATNIVIPETYPFQPVKMKFINKFWVYHLNISSASGAICLDILNHA